jgi:hypothetical protein
MKSAVFALILVSACALEQSPIDPVDVEVNIEALSPGKYRVNNTNVSLFEGQSRPGTRRIALATIMRPFDTNTFACGSFGNLFCQSAQTGTVFQAVNCRAVSPFGTEKCDLLIGTTFVGTFTWGGNPWRGGVEWSNGLRFGLQAPVTEVFNNGF